MAGNLNDYGDQRLLTDGAFGVDIATQRADDLDNMALARVRSHPGLPRALDVASASGGQAIRMATAGAEVIALDITDYSAPFMAAAREAGVEARCAFETCDIRRFDVADKLGTFDVVVCQRMIHYLPYHQALDMVRGLRRALAKGGQLFLSASGLHSELGDDYSGAFTPLAERYVPLAPPMVAKHNIAGDVCLYSVDELSALIEAAGMQVVTAFASAFGNVKVIAQ
ncbi:class I SAM-dependent methyltransferase [Paraburkholderia youngii]|uniref:class I SAM-dependent methyltransferase n=1 Tax=Paraburkholderia youngii TaxID=2782701 RepID=UPI003D1ACDFF